ncbi:fructosamine kinase family protein [Tumidithrix elongata RA019]|uniref:Fructosamine kinase family protein n=1 Tax=Tumidithrix elongata BACA0141 TaxID=2716417 RepID=A0AAW9PQC8_9CYAN|nr:fructosamine kinase family protein [Tumidithrix elongata RA019]
MWAEIAEQISQATKEKFSVEHRQPLGGGSINQAVCLIDRDRKFFVKTNAAAKVAMFEAEAIGLQQMYDTQTIRIPRPICWGVAGNSAYIAMEWIAFGGQQDWDLLARKLAAMHRITSTQGFGWQQQNTIGSTPQINTWTSDWVAFWLEHRLGYQLQLAKRRGFSCRIPDRQIFDAVPPLFENYQPQPSMVHGDLWGGNVAFAQGEPVIFDPALYFGDREVDLAMTELFGGFPSQFYQSYDRAFPLDAGYKQRKTLYNLYHILNHFNLFGGGYGQQASQTIEQICR